MDRAACRDIPHERAMRIFFPEKGQQWKEAKNICCGLPASADHPEIPPCPVRQECLTYALSFEPEGLVGIFGGTTAAERRKIAAGPHLPPAPVKRSYRNLDRLGELLDLVASVNREADNVDL